MAGARETFVEKQAQRPARLRAQLAAARERVLGGRTDTGDLALLRRQLGRRAAERLIAEGQERLRQARDSARREETRRLLAQTNREWQEMQRRDVADRVDRLGTAFFSSEPELHAEGAALLGGIKDQDLADLILGWRARFSPDLRTQLLRKSAEQVTPGLARALELVELGLVRMARYRKDVGTVRGDEPETIRKLANAVLHHFGRGDDHQRGYWLLKSLSGQDQKALLADIKGRAGGYDLIDDLIGAKERTQYAIRAIAVLRLGASDDGHDEVDLAADLLRGDDDRVLAKLESRKDHAGRAELAAKYDQLFKGVGPHNRMRTPDTLRGHLAFWSTSGVVRGVKRLWDPSRYHRMLALLHHEPTEAEQLYFLLPRWRWAHTDEAIKLLKELVRRRVPMSKLEADWNKYVRGGLDGTVAPFAEQGLRDHVREVLALKESKAVRYSLNLAAVVAPLASAGVQLIRLGDRFESYKAVMALLDVLEDVGPDRTAETLAAMGAEQEPAMAAPSFLRRDEPPRPAPGPRPRTRKQAREAQARERAEYEAGRVERVQNLALRIGAEERDARRGEEARLLAAHKLIELSQGYISPNDKQIQEAVGEIVEVLTQRVQRLRARIKHLGEDETVADPHYAMLEQSLERSLDEAQDELERERSRLSARLAGRDIKMSNGEYLATRLRLAKSPTAADEIYGLAIAGDYERMTERLTAIWAEGGMNQFLADCAKPAEDGLGLEVRSPYRLDRLPFQLGGGGLADQRAFRNRPVWQRALLLAQPGMSDVKRGVARLRYELTGGDAQARSHSAVDLADTYRFLATPALDQKLRQPVVAGYVEEFLELRDRSADTAARLRVFLEYVAAEYEGKSQNYNKLRELLAPPQTAEEAAEHARDLKAAGRRGWGHGLVAWLVQKGETAAGSHWAEAADRSQDYLEAVAAASPEELEQMYASTGAKTPQELARHYLEEFKARQGEVQAMEDACVDRLADLVEVAIESGLGIVTGGTGLVAVVNSVVAAAANILVHEAMQGAEFKTFSVDNMNALFQAGLGTWGVEADLRGKIARVIPLTPLKAAWGGKGHVLREGLHNVITGGFESLLSSAAEAAIDIAGRDKWPDREFLARKTDEAIGRMIAKVGSTPVTLHHNPGQYHTYMAASNRLLTQVLFKVSLKGTEAAAKEAVRILHGAEAGQPFALTLWQIAVKDVWSMAKATAKSGASTLAAMGTARAEIAHVTEFRLAHPEHFAFAVKEALKEHYAGEKGAALRAEYAARSKADPKLSEPAFLLEQLHSDPRLRSTIHKSVLATAEAVLGRRAGAGAVGFFRAGQELDQLATEPAIAAQIAPVQQSRTQKMKHLGLADDIAHLREATMWHAQRLHDAGELPQGMTAENQARLMMARLRSQANQEPLAFRQRTILLTRLLDPDSDTHKALRRGDHHEIMELLRGYGNWKQAIEILKLGGPATTEIAAHLVAKRRELIEELRLAGAYLDPKASTEDISDVDFAFKGADAGARMLAKERELERRYGRNWRAMWRMNLYTDGDYLTRYTTVADRLPEPQRREILLDLTHRTEHYCFARMLEATAGHHQARQLVEALAQRLGYPLDSARRVVAYFHEMGPEGRRERRERLLITIDQQEKRLAGATGHDERVRLAAEISQLQMEANFLSVEANLGPGANRELLGKVKVAGLEAYQAALNHYTAFVEHKVEVGSESAYELTKYGRRGVQSSEVPGLEHSPEYLQAGKDFAKVSGKGGDRDVNLKGAHLRREPGAADAKRTARKLSQRYDRFEQEQHVALARLREHAFAYPHIWVPDGLPEPARARDAAAGEVQAPAVPRWQQEVLPQQPRVILEPRLVPVPDKPAQSVPPLPRGFSREPDFGRAIDWRSQGKPSLLAMDDVTPDLVKKARLTLDIARRWRDFYREEMVRMPQNPTAWGRAAYMTYLVRFMEQHGYR